MFVLIINDYYSFFKILITLSHIELRGARLLHHHSSVFPIKKKFRIPVLVTRSHALALLLLVYNGLFKTEL